MSHQNLAEAYHKLLTRIDWSDKLLVSGLREGLNKFLSNAYASQWKKNKYHKTHYVSHAAKDKIENKKWGGLVWEHCVPKQKYIQEPCEKLARNGELKLEFVEDLLNRYWKTATITKEEDGRLRRTSMRTNWDGKDPFDRYKEARIELLDNPNYSAPGELRIVGPLERIGGK